MVIWWQVGCGLGAAFFSARGDSFVVVRVFFLCVFFVAVALRWCDRFGNCFVYVLLIGDALVACWFCWLGAAFFLRLVVRLW